jgi:mono/diheme cytochrome c family protein
MEAGKQFGRLIGPCAVIALAIVFYLMIATQHTDAHTPVTSKYDYNRDVFPRLRDHCAGCHVPDGPAPMSLMTFSAAMPWAQSIRDELTAGRMPPWPVDPTSPPVKGGRSISSRDVDVIVVWASAGTPESYFEAKVSDVSFHPQWKLGPPDLKIPMDADHTVAPNTIEEVSEFSLPSNVTDTKWIKAADLMPGTASIVRDAVISVENGPVLALWQPGSDTTAAPSGAAFRLVPGSKIHLQIHYKKHFDQEQNAISDKSTIGLYFTDPPPSGRELQSLAIDPPKDTGTPAGSTTFGGPLPKAARIVALRPMLDRAYESLSVDAITPSGTNVPLLRLRGPRPQWFRRYWLQEPVELASGSKIEVRVTPLSDYSDEPRVTGRFPLQVVLDYIPL